jgi:hypothetical protein
MLTSKQVYLLGSNRAEEGMVVDWRLAILSSLFTENWQGKLAKTKTAGFPCCEALL